jgi:hypothetical protein
MSLQVLTVSAAITLTLLLIMCLRVVIHTFRTKGHCLLTALR